MTPEDLFDGYDDAIREACLKLRSAVVAAIPGATESVQVGWQTVGYRGRKVFLLISPREKCVRLMFAAGEDHPDPDGVLAPTGRMFWHMEFTDPRQVRAKQIGRYAKIAERLDRELSSP